MLKELTLLKEIIPTNSETEKLANVQVYKNRIQGGTTALTLDLNINNFDKLNFIIDFNKFITAVRFTGEDAKIKITPTNQLSLIKGALKTRVSLAKNITFPLVTLPNLTPIPIQNNFIPILKVLKKFIGDPFLRPWMNSILIKNNKAYATTNPIIVEMEGINLPDMVIPGLLISTLIKLNFKPTRLILTESSIFMLDKEHNWIRSSCIENKWPLVNVMMQNFHTETNFLTLSEQLKKDVINIISLCPITDFPRIILSPEGVQTQEGTICASLDNYSFPISEFHPENLKLVLREATAIDLTTWPKPCPWIGNNIKGILIGIK